MTFVEYHAYGVVISLFQTETNIPETLIKGDELNCMLRGSRSHVFFVTSRILKKICNMYQKV